MSHFQKHGEIDSHLIVIANSLRERERERGREGQREGEIDRGREYNYGAYDMTSFLSVY